MRLPVIAVFVLLLSLSVRAQPRHTLDTFVGPGLVRTQDAGMSPFVFRGLVGTGGMAYRRDGAQSRLVVAASGLYGQPGNRFLPATTTAGQVQLARGDLDVHYLRRLRPDTTRRLTLWLGGTWGTLVTQRLHLAFSNNAEHYEYVSALYLSAGADYDFRLLGRAWRLEWRGGLPVVGGAIRPSFNNRRARGFLTEEGSTLRRWWRSTDLVTPVHFVRLPLQTRLVYPLRRGNALHLTYQWDHYVLSRTATVRTTVHSLWLGTWFRF